MTHVPELPIAREELETIDMTDTMERFLRLGEASAIAGDAVASESSFRRARRNMNGDSLRFAGALLSRAAIYADHDQNLYALHDLQSCLDLLNETAASPEHLDIKKAALNGLAEVSRIIEGRASDWPERKYRDITDEDTLIMPPAEWA